MIIFNYSLFLIKIRINFWVKCLTSRDQTCTIRSLNVNLEGTLMPNYDLKLHDGMSFRLLWIVVLCLINVVLGRKLLCAWSFVLGGM
jgi:hypothetical protein